MDKEDLLGDPSGPLRQYECSGCGYFMCIEKPGVPPEGNRYVKCLYESKEYHTNVWKPWKNGATIHRIREGDDVRLHDELHEYEFGNESDVMVKDVLFTQHGSVDHVVEKGEVLVMPKDVIDALHAPLSEPSEELRNEFSDDDKETHNGRSIILDRGRATRIVSHDYYLYEENMDGMTPCECSVRED